MSTASAAFRLSDTTPGQRKTLIAAALGWALDSFDVMLYALVLPYIITDLGLSKAEGGLPHTFTLIASGIGGILFGIIADRIGRQKALMLSILTYSICSFASAFATSLWILVAIRFVLGLGMGGEWNTGATLVAETWPTHLRAKALSIVQSSWAIGYAAAAVVVWVVLMFAPWRAAFVVGVLPALVTLWIRRDVPESEMWKQHRAARAVAPVGGPADLADAHGSFWDLFSPRFARSTFALLFLNLFGMFGWWGLFSWLPARFVLPVSAGGLGFSEGEKTLLLVILNLTGMFTGYASFGWVADRIGRRKAFFIYTFVAALLVPIYAVADSFWALLLLGTPVAFFGTGFFSGSGIVGSELFPTSIRARALGFTYNGARTLSALAPFVIGWVAQEHGLAGAFFGCAGSFLLAALTSLLLPETLGKHLD
jgi:MFS family permease